MNNTSMAWVLGLIVIIVLLGGAYYFGTQEVEAPTQEESVGGKMAAPKWTLADKGEDATTGARMTEVSVTFAGKTEVVGTEVGSCFVVEESAWALLDGELSGVICYYAGGGNEYGIFAEGDGYVVRKGYVEEGTAEGGGGRAGFETVFTF